MQVHPIFVLSIVDTLLSVLWISGALVWLTGDGLRHHGHLRVGCFSINLLTVVANTEIIIAHLGFMKFHLGKQQCYVMYTGLPTV